MHNPLVNHNSNNEESKNNNSKVLISKPQIDIYTDTTINSSNPNGLTQRTPSPQNKKKKIRKRLSHVFEEDNSKTISKSRSVTPQDVNDNGNGNGNNIHASVSSYGHLDGVHSKNMK